MSLENELVRQINSLQKQVDGLIKPEVPLTLIAESILTGVTASVTFSNIPTGFRNLLLIVNYRADNAAEVSTANLQFNGDGGANYDLQTLVGNNVTPSAGVGRATASNTFLIGEAANSRANNFGPNFAVIFNYASTTAEKHAINFGSFFGDLSADADLFVALRATGWRNTAAITSLTLTPNGGNFVSGSRFQLYGFG